MPELDSTVTILERLECHKKDEYKDLAFAFRLVAANYIDMTTDGSARKPVRTDGKYVDVVKRQWEQGRHNQIAVNLQIQVDNLTQVEPLLEWKELRPGVSLPRQAYYRHHYRKGKWARMYPMKLLDLLIAGHASVEAGMREGYPFLEWADSLDVTWDPAYKDHDRKRFWWRDKHLPASDALLEFPQIKPYLNLGADGRGGEKSITVQCYRSKTTYAVLYKGKFIVGPEPNRYGFINATRSVLAQELSVDHPTGVVEPQLGVHKLMLRLMRGFRETALRGVPVGVALGNMNEDDLDLLKEGQEGIVIRGPTGGGFSWDSGPEIRKTAAELYDKCEQHMTAISGITPFQQGRTDTNVDFASQLSLIASQSGSQGKSIAFKFEQGIKDDANLFMDVGALMDRNTYELPIEGETFVFDEMMPIAAVLGSDGELFMAPGGVQYRSKEQKLQQAGILGGVLQLSATLPEGAQMWFIDMCLTAFEVEEKDEVLAQVQEAKMAQQQAEAEAAMQAQDPQPQAAA